MYEGAWCALRCRTELLMLTGQLQKLIKPTRGPKISTQRSKSYARKSKVNGNINFWVPCFYRLFFIAFLGILWECILLCYQRFAAKAEGGRHHAAQQRLGENAQRCRGNGEGDGEEEFHPPEDGCREGKRRSKEMLDSLRLTSFRVETFFKEMFCVNCPLVF